MSPPIVPLFRVFCLECGPKVHLCEKIRNTKICSEPKVYTMDAKSYDTVSKLWRTSRRNFRKKTTKKHTKCDKNEDMCFEDDWLD